MHTRSLGSRSALLATLSNLSMCSVAALGLLACSPPARTEADAASTVTGTDDGGVGDVSETDDAGSVEPGTGLGDNNGSCEGLQCQQHACGEVSSPTSLSGTIYDPAGKNPLYGVVVFIPNSTPMPLPAGASCDSCSSLYTGSPVVVALTGPDGKFTIANAPDGADIPLVIQVGKWRRQFKIPNVKPCQDNQIPDKTLTLPKNATEGDIPNIAISTGSADTLECLLVRIGLSDSEYVGGAGGSAHIHIFVGGGRSPLGGFGGMFGNLGDAPNTSPAGPASSTALWNSKADLMHYDMVLLSCEGDETASMNQQAMHDYASAGGRVFASHFHYAWFNTGPYQAENLASWSTGSNDLGDINGTIDTSFPKGKIFSQWLGLVGALSGGTLPIQEAKNNAGVTASNKSSQVWISSASAPSDTEYFSFNTPTNAPKTDAGVPDYCGRVVYSDLHVGAASGDYGQTSTNPLSALSGEVVPSGCTHGVDLSAQEKALEFMLFDLSSCVTPDGIPPVPPIQ